MYLQPSATALIYESRAFERKYMQSIKMLDQLNQTDSDARLGKKMVFMIQDFVARLTNWTGEVQEKSSVSELYAKTWTECRNFVLPMNPVRRELEYAVKAALQAQGVSIKLIEKEKPKKKEKSKDKERDEKPKSKSKGKSKKTKK